MGGGGGGWGILICMIFFRFKFSMYDFFSEISYRGFFLLGKNSEVHSLHDFFLWATCCALIFSHNFPLCTVIFLVLCIPTHRG